VVIWSPNDSDIRYQFKKRQNCFI